MCGIFGIVKYTKENVKQATDSLLIKGLEKLEYRGYDSAGVGVVDSEGDIQIHKCVGKVKNLYKKVGETGNAMEKTVHIGIAHTRWATHGMVTEKNSHPQRSKDNEFVVVHNGIITNYLAIKTMLIGEGIEFESETDTECIPKLMAYQYHKEVASGAKPTFVKLMKEAMKKLEGSYGILVISRFYPNEIIGYKNGSPLIIGVDIKGDLQQIKMKENTGKNCLGLSRNEEDVSYYIASDIAPFLEYTNKVIYLEDGQLLHFNEGKQLDIYSFKGNMERIEIKTIDEDVSSVMKGDYPHFLLKEIHEQPNSIKNTINGRIDLDKRCVVLEELDPYIESLRKVERIIFIACGSSYHSAMAIRMLTEDLTKISVWVKTASDFIDQSTLITEKDLCIFISQSGETADSLVCLDYCKERGALCMGVTNVRRSSISRKTDMGIYLNAGPEISVASTKAYTCQIAALSLLAIYMGQILPHHEEHEPLRYSLMKDLSELPKNLKTVLSNAESYDPAIKAFSAITRLIIIARGYQYSTCIEGALKIKELAYVIVEGLSAGELKHGSLALVDSTLPLIMIMTRDKFFEKTYNAYEQVIARNGIPVIMCHEEDAALFTKKGNVPKFIVPKVSPYLQCVVNIIPFQLLAYHIALSKGYDVDCPRSLAKSVTVE